MFAYPTLLSVGRSMRCDPSSFSYVTVTAFPVKLTERRDGRRERYQWMAATMRTREAAAADGRSSEKHTHVDPLGLLFRRPAPCPCLTSLLAHDWALLPPPPCTSLFFTSFSSLGSCQLAMRSGAAMSRILVAAHGMGQSVVRWSHLSAWMSHCRTSRHRCQENSKISQRYRSTWKGSLD